MTKLHRLACSLADARVGVELDRRGVTLDLGGIQLDPSDPKSGLVYKTLVVLSEFETDVVRTRNREGMKAARAKAVCAGSRRSLMRSSSGAWSTCTTTRATRPRSSLRCSASPGDGVSRVLNRARRGDIAVPDETRRP